MPPCSRSLASWLLSCPDMCFLEYGFARDAHLSTSTLFVCVRLLSAISFAEYDRCVVTNIASCYRNPAK